MAIFMVERSFPEALTEEQFHGAFKSLGPCIQARDISWVASHFSTDGTKCVCVFEAADAERIRDANRQAGLPFDKVWPARRYAP